MTRGGQKREAEAVSERRCIATGMTQGKASLIRFVVSPDGAITPDVLEKLPGRGIWVAADRRALSKVLKKGLFARAARMPVTVDPNLIDLVEGQLADRVISLIAMARKAGQAALGYEKVRSWLDTGQARVLIQAADGSKRGKTKLKPRPETKVYIAVLSASELGLAFGREHVIHSALAAGGLTNRIVEEAARLQGLRETDEGGTALLED